MWQTLMRGSSGHYEGSTVLWGRGGNLRAAPDAGCMDCASGSLLMKEMAVHRTYATWDGLVKARLKTFGVEGSYLVRARAKALSQLAETGLNCLSIPDVLHLSHELAKGYALSKEVGRDWPVRLPLLVSSPMLAVSRARKPERSVGCRRSAALLC